MTNFNPRAIDRFDELAEKLVLEYLIIGGYAVSAHSQPRFTADIDYVVSAKNLTLVRSIMDEMKYVEKHYQSAFCQFAPPAPHHPPIDFMLVSESTWEKLWTDRELVDFGGRRKFPVVSKKHLIAMKAHSLTDPTRTEREKDLSDIVAIAKANGLNLTTFKNWGILERYDLSEFLELLKRELGE